MGDAKQCGLSQAQLLDKQTGVEGLRIDSFCKVCAAKKCGQVPVYDHPTGTFVFELRVVLTSRSSVALHVMW